MLRRSHVLLQTNPRTDFSTKLRTQNLVREAVFPPPRATFNVANNSWAMQAQEFCSPKKLKYLYKKKSWNAEGCGEVGTSPPPRSKQSWSGTDILFTCLSFRCFFAYAHQNTTGVNKSNPKGVIWHHLGWTSSSLHCKAKQIPCHCHVSIISVDLHIHAC